MASSRSQIDTSVNSLQSIPGQSPTFNKSSCRALQLTTQHSLLSPKQGKIVFSPRRTVLKLSARKTNVSDISMFQQDKSFRQPEEAPRLSRPKLPEDIISPFPLQRFSVERQTANFVVVLLNEIKANTKLSLRSITPGPNEIDPGNVKDKKLKLDVEAILANMKEIASIAPKKGDQSCRSLDVERNTLQDVLEIPLEHLSPKECAKLRKKRHTPSILSFLEKQFPPRLAYRRKSCCCTWCGGVQKLQHDVENNPWISLLNGWDEHASARAMADDIFNKQDKVEPVVRKRKTREALLTPTSRKALNSKKTYEIGITSVKGISFRDLEDNRGIVEARENEENTPSRKGQMVSSKKLKAFLGASPKTTTSAMSTFGLAKSAMKINLTAISPAHGHYQQMSSGSNSIVFDRNETEGRLAGQASNRNIRTFNHASQMEPGNGERNSFSGRAVSSLYVGNEKAGKLATERNEEKVTDNRLLGGFVTTRSKDSQFSFRSIQTPKKDSIFVRDQSGSNRGVNFTQAVETNHLFNGLVSPAKSKQEKVLKGMLKTTSTNLARKVIKLNIEKVKTERAKQESKEREAKQISEEKLIKWPKLKSIKSRNKDILSVYLSTSMRNPSLSKDSPRKLGYTQFPEIKDLSFLKEETKEKKTEKGRVKLKLRKVEEKNMRNVTENLLINKPLREKEVIDFGGSKMVL